MEIVHNESIQESLYPRFLDYAVDTLIDRAIPDVRDGLKPVNRRILMSFRDLKLWPSSPYRKCAKTVGVCLGNYHPHGDQSVYEALVGMAQNFNMRYPLVAGSGNFGNVNGDGAAAMRYTEARLSPIGELMIQGVDRLAENKSNFDNSGEEPRCLTTYFPNMICNPSMGIAVGFTSKFAPHYARDIYNAIILILEGKLKQKDVTEDDIIDIVKAPDFPTGGIIVNGGDMRRLYKEGHGSVLIRAKYHIDEKTNNIVYTEIPYKVKPRDIVSSIAKLNISDIKDVRDESSLRTGMRIVVELKKTATPEWIINKLFKDTPLQSNYSVIMTVIDDGHPNVNMSLKSILEKYLCNVEWFHRKNIDLQIKDLSAQLVKIDAMLVAISAIDTLTKIIKESDKPVEDIMAALSVDKNQAEYIYNLKLSSLSKASKKELDAKKEEITKERERLLQILSTDETVWKDMIKTFRSVRDSKLFKDDVRHTEIQNIQIDNSLDMRKFIKKESVIINYSNQDMIKATRPDEFNTNRRNAQGVKTKTLREGEFITNVLTLDTYSDLLLFSDLGKAYMLPVYKIPINGRNGASKSINNFINLDENEKILSVVGVSEEMPDQTVVLVTRNGIVKRISLDLLVKGRISTIGTRAITLACDDKIRSVVVSNPHSLTAIFTTNGKGLMFDIEDIKCTGKNAKGVKALKLKKDEYVAGAVNVDKNHSIVLITNAGFGKKLEYKTFKLQKRNQTPVSYLANIEKVGHIVDGITVFKDEDLLITTKQGQILRIDINDMKPIGRTTAGVRFINIKAEEDSVVGISTVKKINL